MNIHFDNRVIQNYLCELECQYNKSMSRSQRFNYFAIRWLENIGNVNPTQAEIDQVENVFRHTALILKSKKQKILPANKTI